MSSDGRPPLPPGPSAKYMPSPARSMRKGHSSEILLDVDTLKLEPRASKEDLRSIDQDLQPPKDEDNSDKSLLSTWDRTVQFLADEYYVPRDQIIGEITAGLVVGLAVVPEAIAFALVVGILPQTGINTTLITSIIVGIFGDRPGLCNGASGAIAVVIVDMVREHGEAYLPYTVVLGGLTCIIFSIFRCSSLMILISSSVMIGFVNGLALIIGLAQVVGFKENMLNDTSPSSRHLLGSFDVLVDGKAWVKTETALFMLVEAAIVIATMLIFPKIHEQYAFTKNIPGSLVGLLFATGFEHAITRAAFGYETRTVGDIGEMDGGLPKLMWNQAYDLPPINGETFGIIAPTAFGLAAVALLEQLMTQELVNDMTKSNSSAHRESFGLGVGNVIAGLFGGMGGNAMINQSVIQVKTGGTHRMSNIIVGLTVLIITTVAYPFVNLMPQAAFIGMMWVTCYYTFEWSTFKLIYHSITGLRRRENNTMINKIKRMDVVVIIIVTIVTMMANLAVAAMCGLLVNLVTFAWDSAQTVRLIAKEDVLVTDPISETQTAVRVYEIEGPLCFVSTRRFLSFFTKDEDPQDVEIHCLNLQVMDFSALDAIAKLAGEYKRLEKRLHLRFLREEDHRHLAKGRGLLKDVVTWRVVRVLDSKEVDMSEIEQDHIEQLHVAAHFDKEHKTGPVTANPMWATNGSEEPNHAVSAASAQPSHDN